MPDKAMPIRFPDDIRRKLKKLAYEKSEAEDSRISINSIVVEAVTEYLERQEKRK